MADSLSDLHKALVATISGYEEALKKTDSATIKTLCQDMLALRATDHQELHALLKNKSQQSDDGGSIMSKVQEVVIDARAAVTGVNENALPSFIRGEESIVEKYDAALKDNDAAAQAILTKQQNGVRAKIGQMKVMQNK